MQSLHVYPSQVRTRLQDYVLGSLVRIHGHERGHGRQDLIKEAMEEESLSQRAKDALKGMADLEQSRGHAAFHLLLLASAFDANLKLLMRQTAIVAMDLTVTLGLPAPLRSLGLLHLW